MKAKRFGPPRYFRPICVLHKFGFLGGPSGYEEVPGKDYGPRILDATDGERREVRAARAAGVPIHKIEAILDHEENCH
jgi:hypothetical protein